MPTGIIHCCLTMHDPTGIIPIDWVYYAFAPVGRTRVFDTIPTGCYPGLMAQCPSGALTSEHSLPLASFHTKPCVM